MRRTIEEIKKILSDVEKPEESFWFCNGIIARNIYELVDGIERLNEAEFVYHVNKEKNDFAKWVREVAKYWEMADALEGIMDKGTYLRIMREMIIRLEASAFPDV